MLTEIAIVVGAYLVASIPTALIAVRFSTGADVRLRGSGNVGATNALRLAGWKVGIFVTVIDLGKGVVPVRLMAELNPASRWLAAAMLAAVIGHCFSLWIGFKGGKGVATAFGAFLVVAPMAAGCVLLVWLGIVLVWRFPAMAATVSAAVFPLVFYLFEKPPAVLLGGVSLVCVLLIARHAGNIRNLVSGVEPKVGQNGGDA